MRFRQCLRGTCAAFLVFLSLVHGLVASTALQDSSIELDVNITTLQTSGDWVTVRTLCKASGRCILQVHALQMVLLQAFNPGFMLLGQVSWSGVRSPSIHDAVALVVPADADAALTAPVKHKWCTASPSHLTNGSGTLECVRLFQQTPTLEENKHADGGLSVNTTAHHMSASAPCWPRLSAARCTMWWMPEVASACK